MEKVGTIVVAAGASRRMAGIDKIFADLAGKPLLARTVAPFQASTAIDDIVIVLSRNRLAEGERLVTDYGFTRVSAICPGGARRQDSVKAGLQKLSGCRWVMVHDGARPFVDEKLIDEALEAAREFGASVPAVPVSDTVKVVSPDLFVEETPLREGLWSVQTPQVFRFDIINEAYSQARSDATDDASLVESLGYKIKVFPGAHTNIKVTTAEDLTIAEAILRGQCMRIGIGYDVHPLVEGRPLVLGGVTLAYELGLSGHSDADVLAHAIIDSLLGAASLRDIGTHFPDSDPRYKDLSSIVLLKDTGDRLAGAGYRVGNIDATVVCEQPRLADHIDEMVRNISDALCVDRAQVSVKASTSNRMGPLGRGEGIAAYAVSLIHETSSE